MSIKEIRSSLNMTQKEFSEYFSIPDTQIFIVRNGVKSAVTSRQCRNIRPIYDQIREHV